MKFINRFFNKYPEETVIKWFKNVCIAEAVSCFLLYGVAMVWKRYDPHGLYATLFIIIIGNIHGLFFTLYLLLCLPCRRIYTWDDEDFVFALLASLFPFATIWVDSALAKKDREE
ncbi:DUF3817 domain-containing protein [Elizabethkingia argentiflava]|uniref:DUF3817 domain-containing protein n=1 Tax=Elizabethkingia argenteiflava TaxID=2681556 RepID=A0A845PNS7_9FLAO|nr:DUF3817 domain-containing protein [Elizabethkingia argenteiflava]NAW49999.1 DUF3817 domain-containing protein [Elizabethkingia argenteiflava]